MLHLAVAEDDNRGREGCESEAERQGAPVACSPCERPPDPAQEPRERVRPEARGAVSLGLLALLPAALDADDEADGESDGKAFDELECVHGRRPGRLEASPLSLL